MKKTLLPLIAALAVLAAAPAAHADKFYKWVDEDGVTHYGATPPENDDTEEVRTYNSASSDQGQSIKRLQQSREAAAAERAAREREQEEARREKQEPDAVLKERCETYRNNLKLLQERPVVRTRDPDTGEETVLTAEERQARIDNIKTQLEKCKKLQ
ncbi:MAG: DUF4124 domain-containing protein [Alcanivoracaceae bacterium]|jgi:preprotein translocase subunit SecD|nr:DUF4124 domain-containing protein [Alcanivoracaceae bacterium]